MTTLDTTAPSTTPAPPTEPAAVPAPSTTPTGAPGWADGSTHARREGSARRRVRLPGWALRGISPVVLLGLWALGSRTGAVPAQILPSPGAVLAAAGETYRDGSLVAALQVSGERVALGFALGGCLGVVLGALVGMSRILDTVIDPPLQMIRTIPFLGLIPLFIAWFGIGETPKIAMVALGASFPLYLNTSAAIRQVDPRLLETARVLRFSPWQRLTTVIVPGALPQVLVGLRQSLGIAWLSLVVAEQVNADAGLGYLINNADQSLRTDIVVFGLIIYALLGLTTDGIVRVLERRALRWRPGRDR